MAGGVIKRMIARGRENSRNRAIARIRGGGASSGG